MSQKDSLKKLLKTALKIESDGANFYSMASKGASNESARKMFNFLAEEEKAHYDFFLARFTALDGGKDIDLSSVKVARPGQDSTKALFNREFIARLKGDNYSLSAVSIGVALEKNSIDFYKSELSKADPSAKKIYDFLIEAEVGHHKLLSEIEKEMIEESWNDNRFSPF